MARLNDMYKAEVAPALMKKYSYQSVMQIPKFDKIVVNIGAGDAKDNSKVIDSIINDLTIITGQKAVPTYAKKSVANFKLRQGMKIGAKEHFAVTRCTNSWTDSSTLLFPEFVTSRVSIPTLSTDAETTPSDLRNSLYSPRSSTTRLTRSAVWTSAL